MEIENFIIKKMETLGEKVVKINRMKTTGNLTYKIQTNKNEYILRLCGEKRRHRSKEEIISEINLIKFLGSKGIPTITPINIKNNFTISFNNKNGILYKFIEGQATNNPTLKQCYDVGKLLGKIHNLTSDYQFSHKRKKWGIERTLESFNEIKIFLLKDKYLQRKDFNKRIKLLLSKIAFDKDLPRGAIHEDLGKRHILFKNGNINGILDWDRSYSNFFILDIGQAIRSWCFNDWKELDENKLKNLLTGYESQRKLSDKEKIYLPDAIIFAFLERIISFIIFSYNTGDNKYKKYAINDLALIETFRTAFLSLSTASISLHPHSHPSSLQLHKSYSLQHSSP